MNTVTDYVKKAETCIQELKRDSKNNKVEITTSQLRKFFSRIVALKQKVDIYKRSVNGLEQKNKLSPELAQEVRYLKVMLAYQCGRNKDVDKFVKKTDLIKAVEEIKEDPKKFEEFCRYLEALVAFHKYYDAQEQNNRR